MTAASPAFRANLADLRSALDRIAPAAPARPPHPILGAVVVDVGDDGAVRLSAFDLQVSVETVVEGALAKAPGRAAVSRADLLRIVKAVCKGETKKTWSGWDVEITATIEHRGAAAPTEVPTHQVHAEVGGFVVPVTAYPPAELPDRPAFERAAGFVVDRDQLADAVGRVITAAGADDTLPALTAVKVELDAEGRVITLAATDRFRLAVETLTAGPLPGSDGQGVELLFPRGPFVAFAKQIPAGETAVEVDSTGSTVRIRGGGTVATVRLFEGVQFPRFRSLLPAGSPHVVIVDGKALSKVVTKAVGLCDRTGVVSVTGDGAAVRVAPYSADRPDGGVRGASVPASGDTDGLLFCVNGEYLAEALSTFGGDVAIGVQHLARSTRPILLAGSEEGLSSGAEYRHLLMPCRMAQ